MTLIYFWGGCHVLSFSLCLVSIFQTCIKILNSTRERHLRALYFFAGTNLSPLMASLMGLFTNLGGGVTPQLKQLCKKNVRSYCDNISTIAHSVAHNRRHIKLQVQKKKVGYSVAHSPVSTNDVLACVVNVGVATRTGGGERAVPVPVQLLRHRRPLRH